QWEEYQLCFRFLSKGMERERLGTHEQARKEERLWRKFLRADVRGRNTIHNTVNVDVDEGGVQCTAALQATSIELTPPNNTEQNTHASCLCCELEEVRQFNWHQHPIHLISSNVQRTLD